MKTWLEAHRRVKVVATDQWYLDFVNELLPLVAESSLYWGTAEEDQQQVALILALYLEDCVADGGNWRQFIRWHQKSYGRYLPFYSLTDEYLPDEINREDVAFLLWAVNSPVGDSFDGVENPLDEDLLKFADVIYNRLDAVFTAFPADNPRTGRRRLHPGGRCLLPYPVKSYLRMSNAFWRQARERH